MKCEYCDNNIPDQELKCPSCGAPAPQNTATPVQPQTATATPVQQPIYIQVPPAEPQVTYVIAPKSRAVYIILTIFFGLLGIHNFYAGYIAKGLTQLLLTICLGWTGVVPCIVFLWCIIEIFVVTKSKNGVPFN